jgi:outer membrane protein assembly factor BamB
VRTIAALLAILASAYAADWLSFGGDPQGTNWQRYGKALSVANVKNLKVLWKRQLGDRQGQLSSPMIIGPTITHRGVRELVFAADNHDNLYAIDADLGTLFWKRHFDVKSKPCASVSAIAPVLEPDPDEDFSDPAPDDEGDDEAAPMRPLYAVSSDGSLHTIRVSDGADTSTPLNFLPPDASYSNLNFWAGTIYATVWDGCNKAAAGLWSLDVKKANAGPKLDSSKGGHGVVIGTTGKVYTDVAGGVASTALVYKGHELLLASYTPDGRLLLLDAANLGIAAEYRKPYIRYNGTATWQDSNGTRWIYAATERNLQAFRLTGPSSKPDLEAGWTFDSMERSGPPVITNGVLFLLTGLGNAGPGYTTLIALDASTGKELYNSSSPFTYNPDLAVANGHVCFGTSDALYCYGIPMER